MPGIEEEFRDVQKRVASELQGDIERVAEKADAEGKLAELRIELKNKDAELDRAKELIDALQSKAAMLEARGDKAKERSERDKLTGLLNKAGFEAKVTNLLEWFAKEPGGSEQRSATGVSLNLAVIDLDDFKPINDTHGHPAGDAALKHVAGLLKATMRENDKVGRWGGDEFVVAFMSPTAGEESLARGAITVTRKLLDALNTHPFVWKDTEIPLRASIGAAKLKRGESYADFFARADSAVLAAKAKGKNRAALAEVEATEAVNTKS